NFLPYKRAFVSFADGAQYDFADCGEISFLNFCLSFLWHHERVKAERWESLKCAYPRFATFVRFFEKYTNLKDIDQHRSAWAQLMADQKLDGFNVVYNRGNRAELIGGHVSFLNLVAILFQEDNILKMPCSKDEAPESIFARFERLIEILNNGQANLALVKDKSSLTQQTLEVAISQDKDVMYYHLEKNHFYVANRQQPRDFDNVLDLTHLWWPIESHSLERRNTLPFEIDQVIQLRALVTRFWGNWDDEDHFSGYFAQLIKNFFLVTDSSGQTKITFCDIPLGREIFFGYLLPNVFLPLTEENYQWCQLLKHMEPYLNKGFFDKIHSSTIANKWDILAYYNQHHYFKKLKRSKDHPDYHGVFGSTENFSRRHPLCKAFRGAAMDVINCITDDGAKVFWKIDPNTTPLEDRIFLGSALMPAPFQWVIKHQSSYFDISAFADVRLLMSFLQYPDNFNFMLRHLQSLN
ncbi:MAG: hypothetical protein Q8K36_03945, partial [Alphaproteobacteria bacterium]|nr:hypothetical protein [Alphaproteobacteria bacterium]